MDQARQLGASAGCASKAIASRVGFTSRGSSCCLDRTGIYLVYSTIVR